jgi:hypothetical protein
MKRELCGQLRLLAFSISTARQFLIFFPLQNPVAALTIKVVCVIHSP